MRLSRVRPIPPDVRSLLVVLPNWVGDCVMATPAYRALRAHFRKARITFLIQPYLHDLLRGGSWMDQCVSWPPRTRGKLWHHEYREVIRILKAERFDAAILLPNSFRAAFVAWQAGALRRIGYHRDGRGWLLTDRMPVKNRINGGYQPMPLVEYLADLVEAVGCPRPDDRLELFTTSDCDATVATRLRQHDLHSRHPLVLICPGAKFGMSKVWLPERFAAVADRLIEIHGASIVISPGPGEEPLAGAIVAAMRHKAVNLQNPKLNLGELKSLVKNCDLLLGNDTGPRHLARAMNVPIVTVFGPTFTQWTATSYAAERILQIAVDCGPCHKQVCPYGHLNCMTGVTVDMVFSACHQLLPETGLR